MAYASDKKPGELTALTTLATDDVFVVGDTSDASEVAKGITKANLITDLGSSFAPALGADDNYVTDAEKAIIAATTASYTTAEASKLAGIEAAADVTDTTNVTAAGALMDSEVTNLAAVKAFDPSAYAAALGADDNYVTDAEKSALHSHSNKATLDNITAAYTTAEASKLAGIEAAADVTDATNVTAAGALMDSELTDITAVKALADAAASDVNTGTSTTMFVTPDALAGSNLGIRYVQVTLNGTTALTTSDVAYFRIPAALGGMNLVSVAASVGTGAAGSSSSGTPTFTVTNITQSSAAMLSTALTVDAGEYTSATAAAAVIDTANDDVATDDLIKVAVTTAGTGVTFCVITLGFALP